METPLSSDHNHTVTHGDKTRDWNVTSHGVCSHQQWEGNEALALIPTEEAQLD